MIEAGALRIDPSRKEVTREGQIIHLTAKEYALLEYMARHAGTVLSRTQLSEHVWDMNFEPTSNVVDVYIGDLRNKVDRPFDLPLIKTVRGHGYLLDLPHVEAGVQPGVEANAGAVNQTREHTTHVS